MNVQVSSIGYDFFHNSDDSYTITKDGKVTKRWFKDFAKAHGFVVGANWKAAQA